MSYYKIKVVAAREFSTLIHTRVFQLSVVLVPLFTVGLGYLSSLLGPEPVAAAVAPNVDPAKAWVPLGSMILIFLMVMLTTPQMMSSVIEEKMSRISEVLLASVSPFDLMLGKLLACCAVAILVGITYLILGLGLAWHFGYSGVLTLQGALTFIVFLILAVFLHGSIFMAVGAACSEPKDAQGMLAPLVLLASAPLITIRSLVQNPASPLAKGLSYFPLSAPFVMSFRMNSRPSPSVVELLLSVGLTLTATLFCVWAASRIFRIGLIAKGKTPSFLQIWHWIFTT